MNSKKKKSALIVLVKKNGVYVQFSYASGKFNNYGCTADPVFIFSEKMGIQVYFMKS